MRGAKERGNLEFKVIVENWEIYSRKLELFTPMGKSQLCLGTLFLFLRKISTELTSAAKPPLFAEEDRP